MAMKRCANGHFYDDEKYQQCPYCSISNMDLSKTMPIIQDRPAPAPMTNDNMGNINRTVAMNENVNSYTAGDDDCKTIGIMQSSKGIDPVVGWLVCIEGPDKGKDYRIRSEKNFIGRDSSMDIAISGDMSISRRNHALVSYNPKNNSFRLYPGESHGIVYCNDEEVFSAVMLNRGDIIELGDSKLIFVPLCGEDFKW